MAIGQLFHAFSVLAATFRVRHGQTALISVRCRSAICVAALLCAVFAHSCHDAGGTAEAPTVL